MIVDKKQMLPKIICLLALITCMPSALLYSQNQADISGRWIGYIDLIQTKLNIIIDFEKSSTNGWMGDIDIPVQGIADMALANIKFEDSSIAFDLLHVPGNAKFSGTLLADNRAISGKFTQSGQTFAFNLSREDAVASAQRELEQKETSDQIRAFVDSTMKIWKTPGLALAIVKDGEVYLCEGFGKRNLKDSLPVTPQTLFAIGSTTKAFTSACLGILADEGKLDWNAKIVTYLPTFKMYDDYSTLHMTPLDLVTHRSGLPRYDLLWYNSSLTRKEIFERLQYLKPNVELRTQYQYNNLMFVTAGYLVDQLSGMTWEEFVTGRIFAPLGMTGSNFSVLTSQKSGDFAVPYRKINDSLEVMSFRDISNVGPAGSINSSAADMSKWLLLLLNKGKFGDKQLISYAELARISTPQMIISASSLYPEISIAGYGLGWLIDSYRGHSRICHDGAIDGFHASIYLYPEDNIGVICLVNLDGCALPEVINYYVTDIMLGLKPIDWNTRIKGLGTETDTIKKPKPTERERVKGTKPSHKLEDYMGVYEHPAFGTMVIKFDKGKLTATFNSLTTILEHWHYDIFRCQDDFLKDVMLTFLTNLKGDLDRLSAPLEPLAEELIFVRKADARLTDSEFLSQLAGEYELEGQPIRFELRGNNKLYAIVPGQTPYELVPYRGIEFNLKGLTGFSVEFKLDEKTGLASEASFKQPNGIFVTKRITNETK